MKVAGVDLGGTRIKTGLVENGDVVSEISWQVERDTGFHERLPYLSRQLRRACEQAGFRIETCRGLGIASTGIVDRESCSVISTNEKHDRIKQVDLPAWADEEFELPLKLENDARCALLGEWHHGAGQGVDDLVMVTLGTGFGSSAVIDGRLLNGSRHRAGILGGHFTVRPDGYECTCGKRGCVETETGGWNLPRIIRDHPDVEQSELSNSTELDYETLIKTAEDGDRVANEILDRRLMYMGTGLVNLIHAYDPERIVLGGGVMNSADLVLPELRRFVAENVWTHGERTVELRTADFPDFAPLLGLYTLFDEDITVI